MRSSQRLDVERVAGGGVGKSLASKAHVRSTQESLALTMGSVNAKSKVI